MAPLIAGMTTTDIPRRFTAHDALQFFNDHRAELSPDQLNSCLLPKDDIPGKIDYMDPWEGLDDKYVCKWTRYRSPPPSLFTRFLRYICQTSRGHAIVARIRRTTDIVMRPLTYYCLFGMPFWSINMSTSISNSQLNEHRARDTHAPLTSRLYGFVDLSP